MSNSTDRIFHGAALEMAQTIHDDDPDFVERADARGGEVYILATPDAEDDAVEAYAEAIANGYPFTVSEWWYDRLEQTEFLVLSHYRPVWGKCSDEQLEQYDDFVEERGGYA